MVVMRFIFNPNAKEFIRVKQAGNIATADSATWAAWGVERLVTVWARMHDRKDGSVAVTWGGCTQSTETKARTGLRNKEPHSH